VSAKLERRLSYNWNWEIKIKR